MLVQSIYTCKTQTDIEKLIIDQPGPQIFFKVFLELGLKSLVSYLAFDAKSIKQLLGEHNKKHFSSEFPVFYKNRDGKSAIDICLDKN